ncbi:MAG: hypothetical protein ACFFC1_13755 [Promethearchaeota archaeon]
MGYIYLKDIQNSPKFGKVLPVDFNLNGSQIQFYPTDEIFSEVEDYFTKKESPDYIWLKGINDLSLFSGFKRLLNKMKDTFPNQKVGAYVNCSLLQHAKVRKVLSSCNLIVINLNTINPSNFSKACVCNEDVNVQDIMDGIKLFRKEFNGYFSIYTMFLKDINDNLEDVIALKNYLLEVNPDHFSVNIFTGKGFEPVSDEFKTRVKEILNTLPIEVSFTF